MQIVFCSTVTINVFATNICCFFLFLAAPIAMSNNDKSEVQYIAIEVQCISVTKISPSKKHHLYNVFCTIVLLSAILPNTPLSVFVCWLSEMQDQCPT